MNFASEGNTSFGHVARNTISWAIYAAFFSTVLAYFFQYGVVAVRTRLPEKLFNRIANARILFLCGLALAVAMVVFPPWTHTSTSTAQISGASFRNSQCSWGYYFILTPPTHSVGTFTIDWGRLVGQWIGIALALGCGLLYFWQERRKPRIHSGNPVPVLPLLVRRITVGIFAFLTIFWISSAICNGVLWRVYEPGLFEDIPAWIRIGSLVVSALVSATLAVYLSIDCTQPQDAGTPRAE